MYLLSPTMSIVLQIALGILQHRWCIACLGAVLVCLTAVSTSSGYLQDVQQQLATHTVSFPPAYNTSSSLAIYPWSHMLSVPRNRGYR